MLHTLNSKNSRCSAGADFGKSEHSETRPSESGVETVELPIIQDTGYFATNCLITSYVLGAQRGFTGADLPLRRNSASTTKYPADQRR